MKRIKILLAALMMFAGTAGCFSKDNSTDPDKYFLKSEEIANSLKLLPPPPAEGSAQFEYDKAQYEWGKSIRDTERGVQAVSDANLSKGWINGAFGEAFGEEISKERTPELYKLLTKVHRDAGNLGTRAAKEYYMRRRPFMVMNESTATPWAEEGLRKNGSYPSGHTSVGWAVALVLSEINPARQLEILQRGYEFGQSRVIVGAHWQSDVDMGRIIGSSIVASLHANEGFIEQLAKAKSEFEKLQKNN